MIGSARRRLLIALLFLLPNLVGFVVFTAGPIAFSLAMSLTDWALTKHNRFSPTPIRWVGLENYQRILVGDESHLFWDYFGNTAFLMLGIPLGIFGSLGLALLVNAAPAPATARAKVRGGAIGAALTLVACAGVWLLSTPGPAPTDPAAPMAAKSSETGLTDLTNWQVANLRSNGAVLAMACAGGVTALGIAFGGLFFRGLFYLPSLLSGVAMFLLWKTLYRPQGGLINAGLTPILGAIQQGVTGSPAMLWYALGIGLSLAVLAWCLWMIGVGASRVYHRDVGTASFLGRVGMVVTIAAIGLGLGYVLVQLPARSLLTTGHVLEGPARDAALVELAAAFPEAPRGAIAVALASANGERPIEPIMRELAELARADAKGQRLIRAALERHARPAHNGLTSGEGLVAPKWLVDSRWAKLALILMGFWAGLGGGTMLLYLAGLSNIPPELYEAASIDGATSWQRFAHVTWPQLAPTTFFIVIMSTIGGLQGGFEQAMVMTQGKADTIVLAYYIYNIAFADQFQLGLASAIAWVMFAMIFAMTLLNFRLGSQLTND